MLELGALEDGGGSAEMPLMDRRNAATMAAAASRSNSANSAADAQTQANQISSSASSSSLRNVPNRRENNFSKGEATVKGGNFQAVQQFNKQLTPNQRQLLTTSSIVAGEPNQLTLVQRNPAAKKGEVGSISRPGPKKGYFKNEANFWPQKSAYSASPPKGGLGVYSRQPRYRLSSAYNKERYLQANCQFVVIDGVNYKPHIKDPDLLVEWENIEEIRISSGRGECPICLYPPSAAKMTRCGHVYCWPCMLHYLALSDQRWRKCPICNEAVYSSQLKSTLIVESDTQAEVNQNMTMNLMMRHKDSTVVVPKKDLHLYREDFAYLFENPIADKYGKLLLVNAEQVKNVVLAREKAELEEKLHEDAEAPEACFIHQALEDLAERSLRLAKSENAGPPPVQPVKLTISKPKKILFYTDGFSDEFVEKTMTGQSGICEAKSSSFEGEMEAKQAVEEPRSVSCDTVETGAGPGWKFFFQASGGDAIYLHPINAHCLVHEYGSLENSPTSVSGRILQLDRYTMSEDLRDRYRYLAHIPLSTNFSLAELKFDKGILSKETIRHFGEEFSRRQQLRQKRARDEKVANEKAQRLERALLLDPTHYPQHVFASKMGQQAPEIPTVTYVASAQSEILSGHQNRTEEVAGTSQVPSDVGESLQSHPSFADMIRFGKPITGNCWTKEKAVRVEQSEQTEAERQLEEASSSVPSYQQTFGDALQVAFDNLAMEGGQNLKGKKGKKQKRKILFST